MNYKPSKEQIAELKDYKLKVVAAMNDAIITGLDQEVKYGNATILIYGTADEKICAKKERNFSVNSWLNLDMKRVARAEGCIIK